MSNNIFFETERLIVKYLAATDFDIIFKIQSNPQTMAFFGGHLSKERIISNFKLMLTHQEKFGFSIGPVFEKTTDNLIGNSGLNHLDFNWDNPVIEIGYFLLPEFWGKGYASELAPVLLEKAFALGAPKVVATVDASNIPSCKICEKMKMTFEGDFPYQTLQGKMLRHYAAYPDWHNPLK